MIIQATDGKWYNSPCWCGDNFILKVEDEELVLKYKGRVLWTTARRVLSAIGIKAKLDRALIDSSIVLDAGLTLASVFAIRPIRPIPVPKDHGGIWEEAPNSLIHGEVLTWKRSGKRWLLIGAKSSVSFATGVS